MDLSSDDKQKMQLDAKYIPGPMVNDRLSSHFHMPMTMNIAYESDSSLNRPHLTKFGSAFVKS
jgi:hypothetical protein